MTGELVTKTLPGLGLLKLTDYLKLPETLNPTEVLSKVRYFLGSLLVLNLKKLTFFCS